LLTKLDTSLKYQTVKSGVTQRPSWELNLDSIDRVKMFFCPAFSFLL